MAFHKVRVIEEREGEKFEGKKEMKREGRSGMKFYVSG